MIKNIPWLLAECADQEISFISNKNLAIDSRYDEKILRVRTGNITSKTDSMISLFRCTPSDCAPKIEDSILDFDLRFHIEPRLWNVIWQGVLIGLLVACQGLVPIFSNTAITEKLVPSILVISLGLLTGIAASFGLKKP